LRSGIDGLARALQYTEHRELMATPNERKQTMNNDIDFVRDNSDQDLSIEQLEDVAGGFLPALAVGFVGSIAATAAWEGGKWVLKQGAAAGRSDRR
jgi:hypothetical protein